MRLFDDDEQMRVGSYSTILVQDTLYGELTREAFRDPSSSLLRFAAAVSIEIPLVLMIHSTGSCAFIACCAAYIDYRL